MSNVKLVIDEYDNFTHVIVNGRKVYTRAIKSIGVNPEAANEFVGTCVDGETFTIYGGRAGGGSRTDWWFAMDNMLVKCNSLKEAILIPSNM